MCHVSLELQETEDRANGMAMNYYSIPLSGCEQMFMFSEKLDDGGWHFVLSFGDKFIFSSEANKKNADIGIGLCELLNEKLHELYEWRIE